MVRYAHEVCWCSIVARLLVDQAKSLGCPLPARSHLASLHPPRVASASTCRVCGVRAPSRPISLPSSTRRAAPYSAHGVRPRLTVACCYKPSGDYRFCCQWVVTCGGGGSRFGPTRIRAPFPRRAGRRGRRPFAFCFTSYGDAGKSLGSRLKPLRRGSGSVDSDSVFRGRTGSPWGMERSQVRTCW